MAINIANPKYGLGDWLTAVSAAGTTQATATTLAANFVEVSTTGAGAGVIVKQYDPGDIFGGYNSGSNTLLVYPPSSGQFNGKTANLALSVPTNGAWLGMFLSSTKIMAIVYG